MKLVVVKKVVEGFIEQFKKVKKLNPQARMWLEVQVNVIKYVLMEPEVREKDNVLLGVDMIEFLSEDPKPGTLPPLVIIDVSDIAAMGFIFPADWSNDDSVETDSGLPNLIPFDD